MTVYIAGAITGVEDYKARFAAAKRMLLREGEDRPISMERYYGTPRADKVLNPAELPEDWPGKVYMDVCLAMIRAAAGRRMILDWILQGSKSNRNILQNSSPRGRNTPRRSGFFRR